MLIQNKPVWLMEPDFSEPPQVMASNRVETFRLGQSLDQDTIFGPYATHSLRFRYTGLTASEIDSIASWFCSNMGQTLSFWTPSWHSELLPVTNLASGATSITCEYLNFAGLFSVDPGYLGSAIFIYDLDTGNLHITNTTAILTDLVEKTNTLAIETALPWGVAKTRCVIGFLYPVRFGADNLELEYTGLNTAKATITLQETRPLVMSEDPGIMAVTDFVPFGVAVESGINVQSIYSAENCGDSSGVFVRIGIGECVAYVFPASGQDSAPLKIGIISGANTFVCPGPDLIAEGPTLGVFIASGSKDIE